jgi:hypothetical protein
VIKNDEAARQEVHCFMMGLRLLLAKGQLQELGADTTNMKNFVLGDASPTDIEFWVYLLSYYRHRVLVDDLGAWNDEQIEYYRRHGNYLEQNHMKRRTVIE